MKYLQRIFSLNSNDTYSVQVACDGLFIAFTQKNRSIVVIKLIDLPLANEILNNHKSYVELKYGHYNTVSALAFNDTKHHRLLCSCSTDYIILWNIQEAKDCFDIGQEVRGRVIAENLGSVQYCSFSPDSQQVAACVENLIYIISCQCQDLVATLEGHNATVTCVKYFPHHLSTVVSVSCDRTFKVWDVAACILLYQSTILCASPLISLAVDPTKPLFTVGTSDGQVWLYDMSEGSSFRCVHSIDISSTLRTLEHHNENPPEQKGPVYISSRPSWLQAQDNADSLPVGNVVEPSCSILALAYSPILESETRICDQHISGSHHSSHLSDAITQTSFLYVGTMDSLFTLNANTLEVCSHINFQDCEIPSLHQHHTKLSAAASMVFCSTSDVVWCIMMQLFGSTIEVLRWHHPDHPHTPLSMSHTASSSPDITVPTMSTVLSVLSSEPLLDKSPLRAVLIPKKRENVSPTKGSQKLATKNGAIRDQPLTFKNKIKSSGYTVAPRNAMFKPDTGKPKQKCVEKKSKASSIISDHNEYPLSASHPKVQLSKVHVSHQPHSVACVSISGNGHHLACAISNSSAQVYRLPLSPKSTTYTAHKGSVDWVRWSHDNQKFITSSSDNSALVWVKGHSEPILCIEKSYSNITAALNNTQNNNQAFKNGVKFAQFYYIDQFILLVNENAFHLYKYSIDSGGKDDVKRYAARSHYKCVSRLQLAQAKQITAFSAINSFHSYIALVAGSDRTLSVYDMNRGELVRQIESIHTRPCHTLYMNEGSMTISHPPTSYDLYVTAAVTDGIKLWDLRTARCVQKYESHINRSQHCGLSMSACGRFLATGSEDKSVYVYDVRGGTYLEKLTGHTDVVSDVQFHPNTPNLISAALDGVVHEYGPVT